MKILLRFSPLLLLPALMLGSCQLEKLQDPIVITNQIEKEFYIDLKEYLHPTNRQLRFEIRTINEQECLNNTLETDYYILGREINLSINSILPAADCQAGMAPAQSEILAGKLSNGIYKFDLALRNTVVNKGILTVREENYSMKMETQEGIIFLHNNLQKMPSNTLWGYIICEESEWESLQAALTDMLSGQANPATYRPGYYGYFEINNNTTGTRNVFLTEPPTAGFHFPLLYELKDELDENRLKTILADFRAAHPGVSLAAQNADGRIF